MEIYDLSGNLMDNPDLGLGRLEDRTRTVHHDAVEAVREVWHYETVHEYPNGGKDVRKVIDTPGVEAAEAYDEEIPYQVYIPYTEEELAAMNQPETEEPNTLLERLAALEEQNVMLMECLMEMSEIVYQ